MATPSATKRATLVGAAITAALAMSVPAAQYFEGLVLTPGHKDPRGYADVCYGDRTAERHTYTPEQCAILLVQRQARDYQPVVINCVPALATRPHELAAATDAQYNGGAFCKSPMAAAFNRGQWITGANAYLTWHTLPGTNVHKGLVKRRRFERCLSLGGSVEQCIRLVA